MLKKLACFQAVRVHTEYVVCNRAIVTRTKGFLWNMLKVRKYGLYYKCDTSQKAQKTGITATNQLEQKKESKRNHLGVPADANICGVLRSPGPLPFTQVGRLQI